MKKRLRSVVAITVALFLALPMAFAPVAFAADGNPVHVHLNSQLATQKNDIDRVEVAITFSNDTTTDNAILTVLKGSLFCSLDSFYFFE